MVRERHKIVGIEEDTVSFVEVNYDDYLYDEDGREEYSLEEEYDISFGVVETKANSINVDNAKKGKYSLFRDENILRGTNEDVDLIERVLIRPEGQNSRNSSVLTREPSRILRRVFTNHLMLRWVEDKELSGERYRGNGRIEAPFEHDFAGIRTLENGGSRNSTSSIRISTFNIKRNGQKRYYNIHDVMTNIYDGGNLCSWAGDRTRMYLEDRDDTMHTPKAIYKYYDVMTQGVSNTDLAGANMSRLTQGELAVILEDYINNYLESIPDSNRKDTAITVVRENIETLKENGNNTVRVSTAELATISFYSERYYIEFSN